MKQDARFVLVYRKSRLRELIQRFNTWQQAKFYLEQSGADFADYHDEDAQYQSILDIARQRLSTVGRLQVLERGLLPSYQFHSDDIIIVIGQDGLVANTIKYLNGNPVIAINPDKSRWDGVLLPFEPKELEEAVSCTLDGSLPCKSITVAEARASDGQILTAVNDFFIGPKSHTSARYSLVWNGKKEKQSSSGIIISTGLGSTGWLQSILAGAKGVSGAMRNNLAGDGFAWDKRELYFAVREPFPSVNSGAELVSGYVRPSKPLVVESHMPDYGVIFSDGLEDDCIAFNSGVSVTVGICDVRGRLMQAGPEQ